MAFVKKSKPAKYQDKSAEQAGLIPVFNSLKKILSGYAKGHYVTKADKPGQYELYYNREVEVEGKKYPELGFASLLIQKGYVGFYFFPIYPFPSLKKRLNSQLLKCLKGKTCFHIREQDMGLVGQIEEALQVGYKCYQSMGWI